MKLRTLFLILTSLILASGSLRASTDEAEKHLQSAVYEVIAAADHSSTRSTLEAAVRPILEKNIGFDAMTRHAVGPGWRQFTPEQQKEATRLFATLVIRTYISKFTPGEHPLITLKAASSPAPGRVEVPTTILYKGNHYDVTYRMEDLGGWHITDVIIEGVSLIANYRPQFDAQFKENGASSVLNSHTRSVDEKR